MSFGVTANPTAEWILLNRLPRLSLGTKHLDYVIRDRDTAYGPLFVHPSGRRNGHSGSADCVPIALAKRLR